MFAVRAEAVRQLGRKRALSGVLQDVETEIHDRRVRVNRDDERSPEVTAAWIISALLIF